MATYILNAENRPFSDPDAARLKAERLTHELGWSFDVVPHPDGGYAVVSEQDGEAGPTASPSVSDNDPLIEVPPPVLYDPPPVSPGSDPVAAKEASDPPPADPPPPRDPSQGNAFQSRQYRIHDPDEIGGNGMVFSTELKEKPEIGFHHYVLRLIQFYWEHLQK